VIGILKKIQNSSLDIPFRFPCSNNGRNSRGGHKCHWERGKVKGNKELILLPHGETSACPLQSKLYRTNIIRGMLVSAVPLQ
jgi:hypothetical protein